MTVAAIPGTGVAVPYDPDDLSDLGLEDIGAGELTVPRLEIVHDKGVFRDRNTKTEYSTLNCIILGVVKQRIMWDKVVDDGDKPQCRSANFELGWPQMRTDIPKSKQFPWVKSNFNPEDQPTQPNGLVALSCESCVFKDWNAQDWTVPPCSEQYTFIVLYQTDDSGNMAPAILTLQRSAAKACKQYLTFFKGAKQPMFTVQTTIDLSIMSRGKVTYSTPVFKRGLETDRGPDGANWRDYASTYRSIREFLRQAPRGQDDDEGDGTRTEKPRPASAAAATALSEDDPWASAAAPAAAATPAANPSDDDLPF